jgi:hypothetical protein
MAVRDRPLLTDLYDSISAFAPPADSAYFYGVSPEVRSDHVAAWQANARDVRFIKIVNSTATTVTIENGGTVTEYPLRSHSRLRALVSAFVGATLYLDITGLPHHVWAPLLRAMLRTGQPTKGVYVEPKDYKFSEAPTEGDIFDLSERISGIAPIPGFTSLNEARNNNVCFVPLLGFEGPRLAYLIEQIQPPGAKIVPVIGVPGFRPEYPFYAFLGNRVPLAETKAWRNVRFAIANCPFSLFFLLGDIASEYQRHTIKIAPIGTKPHALGAVLFAIVSPRPVELVYDHPIRKTGRTTGALRLLVYHLSSLATSLPTK